MASNTIKPVSQNGTDGRVYGGDAMLIHIKDGTRQRFGKAMADELDWRMRMDAEASGARTPQEAGTQQLCPGCYMIASFHMLVQLAKSNGQSMEELGASMAAAFQALRDGRMIGEEINVILEREHA